jgi:hypothetical protein
MTTDPNPRAGQELARLSMPDLGRLADAGRTQPPSALRFADGGQYRIEIPSVEGPEAFESVLAEAADRQVTVHRISQGSGITLLTDAELRAYASLGARARVEVCLFVGPRAPWDGNSAAALTPDGQHVACRHVGMRALRAALGDVHRAADAGIRSILIADEGLAMAITSDKQSGRLPAELVVKASALMGIANPVGAALLGQLGIDSLNIGGDTPLADLAAFRAATSAYLDLYIEGPDNLGGFMRYHDLGEIVRIGAPVYLKFGLRNAPGIYPAGGHLRATVHATARERVRRAQLGLEHLGRQYADAVPSPAGSQVPGIPVLP